MKSRIKILTSLSIFALLLTGCSTLDGGSSSGGGGSDNPPLTENSYTITWKNYDGTVLEIDEKVTAGAIPSYDGTTPLRENTQNYKYTFSGWSPEIKAVTSDATYTAQYDGVLTAAYVTFDLNGGRTNSNSQSRYMSSIDAENFFFDVTKDDYNFRGWEYNGRKIFDGKGNKINNADIAETMTFKALFAQTAYLTITSNLKDAGVITGEGEYEYGSEVTLTATPLGDNSFKGWYLDNELLSNNNPYSFTIGNADLSIEGRFAGILYTISFETNGGDPIADLVAEHGDPISVNPTRVGHTFVGWYTDSSCTLTSYFELGDTMPAYNGTLYAKWTTDMYTVFEMDSKQYIYFGSYPQSVVSDSSLKTELSKITTTNSRGYYEYGGNEYAKKNVSAYAYSSSYKYANGTQVTNYTTEYFKVEPILWRILTSDSSGNYTLLAEQAINAHRYDYSSNDYEYSDIRTWLNNGFYNSAFKSMEKGAILTTTVDNSAATTNSTSNRYACDNTSDKVYLLSYKDYLNSSYDFSTSAGSTSTRYCKPTDYAIANGSYMDEGGSYDRNCNYWTRSPGSDYSLSAWSVDYDGYLDYSYVRGTDYSVRPSLSITIA